MMTVTDLMAMVNNYLLTANEIYIELKDYLDSFKAEQAVVSYIKCPLLKREEIGDFSVQGIEVHVMKRDDGYLLSFQGNVLQITVYEGEIVSYSFKKA